MRLSHRTNHKQQASHRPPQKAGPGPINNQQIIKFALQIFFIQCINQQLTQAAPPNTPCQLPPTWAGRWFQSNKEPIRITNSEISDKGICRDQKGDKYLFEYSGNKLQQESCYYCLVINERHLNVLQYKESTCQPAPTTSTPTTTNQTSLSNSIINNNNSSNIINNQDDHSLLDSICSEINGDATLESLFRLDAPAIECPINRQYSFTYDFCKETQSTLDSCIDKKQLNFKYSACQDVPGSESKFEVLKCYAEWTEGNNYYMIGRLEYTSDHHDKGKFRCFIYDKSPDGKFIQMSQTLEENCYGLSGPTEGPKVLRLTAKAPTQHKCNFPSYIQSSSENWLSVDNSLIYIFNQNSTKYQVKETKEGNIIEEAACLQQFTYPSQAANNPQHPHSLHHHQQARVNPQLQQQHQIRRHSPSTSNYHQNDQSSFYPTQISSSRASLSDVIYLVQITKNCQTTQYCVRFYKRSNGIVQIDYYLSPPNGDNQCRVLGSPQTQIITSTTLENQRCPFEGLYTIDAPKESDLTYNPSNIFICPRQSFLTAQCDHPSKIRVHSRCTNGRVKNLYCLGSWTTGGLVRLLLADDDRQRYSAWYKDYDQQFQVQNQDGSLETILPQAQAFQQQQLSTRSQHLMSVSMLQQQHQQQPQSSPIIPFIDLNIALITPIPIPIRTMQVRLTKKNQCSDLRYPSSNYPSSSLSSGIVGAYDRSSAMLSYNPPASASSGETSRYKWLPSSQMMTLIFATIFIKNLISSIVWQRETNIIGRCR